MQAPLKYLFTCVYKDESLYYQNPSDISATDPSKSCFFDVRQEDLALFQLSEAETGNWFAVNLVTGEFLANGLKFRMHEEALSGFRLIFFRRHTHQFNSSLQEKSHSVVYRMGWQATDEKGQNIQRIMQLE